MADRIYHYHEHDSLLENKVEENLTEEERKAAWEEFEREKSTGYRQQVRRAFQMTETMERKTRPYTRLHQSVAGW